MAGQALVLGYFGADNWGDELILRSFLRSYRELLEQAEIRLAVTVRNPVGKGYVAELQDLYPQLGVVRMTPFLQFSPVLARYRYLFCPGGSLLQNKTSNRSLTFYLSLIKRFGARGKHALMLNQGIGPVTGDNYVRATKAALGKLSLFTARDQETLEWVRDTVPADRLHLSSDGVFSCEQPFGDVEKDTPKKVFAFVLRAGLAQEAMEFIIGSVPRTHAVYLAALQSSDLDFIREIRVRTIFPHERVDVMAAQEFSRRLPGCQLLVSERYHGLVAALAAKVPFIGIGDDPKLMSFCKEAGMPCFVRDALHEATAEELLERAQHAFSAERFRSLIAQYRSRQETQKAIVTSILPRSEPPKTEEHAEA
jgi:polysaccharide pyruvyl transferase WcaK-like protein